MKPRVKNLMAALLVALTLLATLFPQSASSQTPTPDEFNPGANDVVYSVAVQADGKILVGGLFTALGGQPRNWIARLNADGSLDSGFNPATSGGSFPGVSSLVVQADGKILVGGDFTTLGGQPRNRIARLNADGTLDSGFNPGANNTVFSLAVQADRKILVAGNFTTLGGQPRNRIALLNADGNLDSGFNPGASGGSFPYVFSLAVQADGRILVGGGFTTLGGQARNRIARLNTDGTLDSEFNPGASAYVFSMAVQADGKILVGGNFTTLGGQPRNGIARLNADGTLDSGFNPGANNAVKSLAVQADGKILVGGDFAIARLNADGTLDNEFNPGANSGVLSLAVQADGKILVGGRFTTLGGQPRIRIARLNNTESATQSLSYDGSTITWMRGGTSPEAWRTTFESSTDGAAWTDLGAGTRIPAGWQLAGVFLPPGGTLRARGYVSGGHYNASGWFVETLWPPQPSLTNPHWLNSTNFAFTLLAETNFIYRIDASSDFATWNEVLRLTNPPSAAPVVLPVAPGQSLQFFRAVLP